MADAQGSGLHETLHGELGAPLFTAPGREWIANGWNLRASFPGLPLYSRPCQGLGLGMGSRRGHIPTFTLGKRRPRSRLDCNEDPMGI